MSLAFRIIIVVVVLIAMIALPLLVQAWTLAATIAISWVELLCACVLLAVLTPPRLSAAFWRVLAGLVFLTFVGYLAAELISSGGTLTTSKPSQHSVLSALLGLVLIGGPSLKYALRGREADQDETDPEGNDTDETEGSEA